MAKGGGGDVKARFATLNPSDNVADWVIDQLPGMGAGWCPPGTLGIGIGGTPEQAMLLAKLSLFEPIDMDLLLAHGAADAAEALRLEVQQRANALGIGAQGLGGISAVLDVKVRTAPCHAAALPVAGSPTARRHGTCGSVSTAQGQHGSTSPRNTCGTESPIASTCPMLFASISTSSTARRWRNGASAKRCC